MNETARRNDQVLFWGCFIALITTAFAFVGRLFLLGQWGQQFQLDPAEAGRLAGIGIWPFAVSIILFSLVIDKIGYKTAMIFAFLGHLIWAVMGVAAYYVSEPGQFAGLADVDRIEAIKAANAKAYQLLYWGSLICALANGTVEAFINPLVATLFNREKIKWLNILHAGWPGGLVITGLLVIGIDTFAKETPWSVKVGLIAIPAVIYFLMLIGLKFPQSERVTAGVSYREMLQEFGIAGAAIVAFLAVLQVIDFLSVSGSVEVPMASKGIVAAIGVAGVIAFGAYTRSIGRGLMLFLILIMMPLATTEIGTDGWITAIMEGIAAKENFHSGWVLVYTSAIMLVLRFFAGPIVHRFSPLGLLVISSIFAIIGLMWLSQAEAMMIFAAATLYGIGKTFFWPTMLGLVSEQFPKGGALTLNALGGIGMLAVGTLGTAYIGVLQTRAEQNAIVEKTEVSNKVPGLVQQGKIQPLEDKTIYEVLKYQSIDEGKLKGLITTKVPAEKQDEVAAEVKKTREESKQRALFDMAAFPAFMLVCYIVLILWFRTRGGYKPVELSSGGNSGHH